MARLRNEALRENSCSRAKHSPSGWGQRRGPMNLTAELKRFPRLVSLNSQALLPREALRAGRRQVKGDARQNEALRRFKAQDGGSASILEWPMAELRNELGAWIEGALRSCRVFYNEALRFKPSGRGRGKNLGAEEKALRSLAPGNEALPLFRVGAAIRPGRGKRFSAA